MLLSKFYFDSAWLVDGSVFLSSTILLRYLKLSRHFTRILRMFQTFPVNPSSLFTSSN